MKSIVRLLMLVATFAVIQCGKSSQSPEEKLVEILPKFQNVLCSKMMECSKAEMAQIPEQYRSMIPPFMQSQEKCVGFFNQKFEEGKKQRQEEKREITMEEVNAFESCINALDKTNCSAFKDGKPSIPGCEALESLK
ncbi:hypothetical protein LPTSP4_18570 [Leptospira ryugenii]|uniref:Lipoprotein n=1 Tax=Leptospira ryugenii TaxID=1917863 RepID=A0A2P2E0C7_9LEPT|nr:hypothetical protein [Leptospira ryugenii]GBF50332.1 hypothetical protein LPTSP4_18570 [Leptospira ryugenii]